MIALVGFCRSARSELRAFSPSLTCETRVTTVVGASARPVCSHRFDCFPNFPGSGFVPAVTHLYRPSWLMIQGMRAHFKGTRNRCPGCRLQVNLAFKRSGGTCTVRVPVAINDDHAIARHGLQPTARPAILRGVLKKKQRMRGGLGSMKYNLVYCGDLATCKCQHTWGRRRHGSYLHSRSREGFVPQRTATRSCLASSCRPCGSTTAGGPAAC